MAAPGNQIPLLVPKGYLGVGERLADCCQRQSGARLGREGQPLTLVADGGSAQLVPYLMRLKQGQSSLTRAPFRALEQWDIPVRSVDTPVA